MRLTAPVGVILVLVAVAASPGVGRAAVCEGYQPVSFIYPAGGLTHVPTNTLIWVGDAWTDDGSTLELWEHNGDQIDVVETTIEAGRASVTVLRPTIELVHAAYRIVAVRPDGRGGRPARTHRACGAATTAGR